MLLDIIRKNEQLDEKRLISGIRGYFSGRYDVRKTAEFDLFEIKPLTADRKLVRDEAEKPVIYFVKPEAQICTCPDFVENKVKVCKHIIMAALGQDVWLTRLAWSVYNKAKAKKEEEAAAIVNSEPVV